MINFKLLIVYCLCLISFFTILITSCTQQSNQLSAPHSKEELGKLLFFDSILSQNNTVSCASCHKPEYAFADNVPLSFGVDSLKGIRNTPSAMNLSGHSFFFHDGRTESLLAQASGPMENPLEMNIPLTIVVQKLNKHTQYRQFFIDVFGQIPNKLNVAQALEAYEESLSTSDTPFDNYMTEKDTLAFSSAAKRGRVLFMTKAKCFDCHFGPDFTNDEFKNIGIFNGKELNDSGRFLISRNIKDIGSFKVPGLRNVSMTKPYMHNGMFNSLKEVIDYYDVPDKFIPNAINRDTSLAKPLKLTQQEKRDLEEFLLALTDNRFKR